MSAADRGKNRFLERALLANFVVHGLAMLAMALLLAPMLPGGGQPDPWVRIQEIAAHPFKFRLGWFPWQLCALADLWLAIAMVRVRWIPKAPSIFVLLATIAAVIPDQYAQAMWITKGIELAQAATNARDVAAYLQFERSVFIMTAACGAFLYTLAALGWTVSFAMAKTWNRTLTLLSVPTWGAMLFVTCAFFVPQNARPAPEIIAIGNAIGFTLLQLWLALVTEQVLRRSRPITAVGRDALYRHPFQNVLGRAIDLIANSRFVSAFLEPLPAFAMRSDITHVVYVNYIVKAEKVLPLVPQGLSLQRLGRNKEYALFTFLTFKHGRFGFRLLGPLRRLMPSPIQSNWRIHVEDPARKTQGIFFVTNAIDATPQALGARMLTEGMPMHVFESASLDRNEDGTLHLSLSPGAGSAPDCEATLRPCPEPTLKSEWKACFSSFRDFLAYCVPQDRAMSTQPSAGTITRQEIDLGIPLDACEPLIGEVISKAAEHYVGDAKPLCFRVPSVNFKFEIEEKDALWGGG